MSNNLPPAMLDAARDTALKGGPITVYLWLWGELEPHDFRPLRASYISGKLRVGRDTALRALDVLVERGYLAEGRRTTHGIRMFRILTTRRKLET